MNRAADAPAGAGRGRAADLDQRLDEALEETFPASDPIAVSPEADGTHAVLTVGHSTRPIADFVALLRAHGVTQLVDVRTVPRSRHNPQFNGDALAASLAAASIGYAHAAALGARRAPGRSTVAGATGRSRATPTTCRAPNSPTRSPRWSDSPRAIASP